jgi:PAS domain S-box-containing protein
MAPEQAQAYLAALVASSEDAIKAKTLDGTVTVWNSAAERLYGYSAAEMIGHSVSIVIPPDLPDELPRILARIARGERIEHYETQRVRKDGRRIDVAVSISPVRDGAGRVIGAATIARDITAERRARRRQEVVARLSRALAEAHDDLGQVLDSVAHAAGAALECGVLVHLPSADGARLDVAALHDPDPEIQALWREMLEQHPQRADRGLAGRVYERAEGELIADYSLDAVRAWAEPAHLTYLPRLRMRSAIMVPARARGRVVGVLGAMRHPPLEAFTREDLAFLQDVADRVGLAIDNARLYVEAQEAARLRDEFLAVAAHELRTPITSVRGGAQLLRRRVRSGQVGREEIDASLAQIDGQSRRLTRLIEQLLDVSRLEAGRLELEPARVDLAALIAEVVAARQARHPEQRVVLRVHEPVEIVGDDLRLEQVVVNLLSNAVKFSPPDAPVDVEVSRGAGEGLVAVRDRGPGIPPEDHEHVFERFYQVDRTRHYGGMGIGLYVSREIVALHGGTISVELPADGGTRMVVRLPLAGSPAAPKESARRG